MGGITKVIEIILLSGGVVLPIVGMVDATHSQLQSTSAVVDVRAGHLLPAVSLLFPFERRAVKAICFERGDLTCIGEVGIHLPGGVESGDVEFSHTKQSCRTAEEATLGGGEMPLGLLCTSCYLITAPALANAEVIVQNQSLAEGETVVAQCQCL